MNPAQALLASLARSRWQAHADFDAAGIEHITIEPPVWCHGCNRMLTSRGHPHVATEQVVALCPQCAPRPRQDRRDPATARLRELVEVTRLLAWQAHEFAADYARRGCHESARVQRELAEAANNAIEALRINREEI